MLESDNEQERKKASDTTAADAFLHSNDTLYSDVTVEGVRF